VIRRSAVVGRRAASADYPNEPPLVFPALSEKQRLAVARRCFRNIARSGLDRSVLSKGDAATVERYVKVQGIEHLQAAAGNPLILIAPHFVGLDAGGIRFNTFDARHLDLFEADQRRVGRLAP
jgi:KDO2-lipid IV(A) lauroyltransferase